MSRFNWLKTGMYCPYCGKGIVLGSYGPPEQHGVFPKRKEIADIASDGTPLYCYCDNQDCWLEDVLEMFSLEPVP